MSKVDKVLKGLSKCVTKLQDLAKQERSEAAQCHSNAHELKIRASQHTDEAERAEVVVENLKNLLQIP